MSNLLILWDVIASNLYALAYRFLPNARLRDLRRLEYTWAISDTQTRRLVLVSALDVLTELLSRGDSLTPTIAPFGRLLLSSCRSSAFLAPSDEELSINTGILIPAYITTDGRCYYVRDIYADIPHSWYDTLDDLTDNAWACDLRYSKFDCYDLRVRLPVILEDDMPVLPELCESCNLPATTELLIPAPANRFKFSFSKDSPYKRVALCGRDARHRVAEGDVWAERSLGKDSLTLSSLESPLTVEQTSASPDEYPYFMRPSVDELGRSIDHLKSAVRQADDLIENAIEKGDKAAPHIADEVATIERAAGNILVNATNDDFNRIDVSKASDEKRYTFGVVYKPETPDSHNEYLTADDLQKSLHDHVRKGKRDMYFQHGRDKSAEFKKAGEWVELAMIPFEIKASFKFADGSEEERVVPANSVWMGTIWDEWAWEKVKSGEIRGLSFGGTVKAI